VTTVSVSLIEDLEERQICVRVRSLVREMRRGSMDRNRIRPFVFLVGVSVFACLGTFQARLGSITTTKVLAALLPFSSLFWTCFVCSSGES